MRSQILFPYNEEDFLKSVVLQEPAEKINLKLNSLLRSTASDQNRNLIRAVRALLHNDLYHSLVNDLFESISIKDYSAGVFDVLLQATASAKLERATITLLRRCQQEGKKPSDLTFTIMFNLGIEHSLPNLLTYVLKHTDLESLKFADFSFVSQPEIITILLNLDFAEYIDQLTMLTFEKFSEELLIEILKKYKVTNLFEQLINSDEYDDDQLIPRNLLENLILLDKRKLVAYFLNEFIQTNNNNNNPTLQFPFLLINSKEMYEILIKYGSVNLQYQEIIEYCNKAILYFEFSRIFTKGTQLNQEHYCKIKSKLYFLESIFAQPTYNYGGLKLDFSYQFGHLYFEQLLVLAAKEGLTHVLHYLYLPNRSLLLAEVDRRVLLTLIQNKNYDFLSVVLPLLNVKTEEESILQLIKYCLKGLDNRFLDLLLANEKILQLLINDYETYQVAINVRVPKLACSLINKGIEFDQDNLKELITTALLQKDHESYKLLNEKLLTSFINPLKFKYDINEFLPLDEEQTVLQSMYGTGISQKMYQYYVQQIIMMITSSMANNTFSLSFGSEGNLDLKMLGDFRQVIAFESKSDSAKHFGLQRSKELVTSLNIPRYKPYLEKFVQHLKTNGVNDDNWKDVAYVFGDDQHAVFHGQILGTIDGMKIELTSYAEDDNGYSWLHTSSVNIPQILDYVNELINKLLAHDFTDTPHPHQQTLLIDKISEIHWWMSHAAPFQRGSAAITEWIINALFLYHGVAVKLKPLTDCEALISPSVNDFKQKYASLLEEYTVLPRKSEEFSNSNSNTNVKFAANLSTFHHSAKQSDVALGESFSANLRN